MLRLLTSSDFNAVFTNSKRIGSPFLTLVVQKNKLNFPRIGFALAKKQVKRAHERNRLKRLAREYFRLNQHEVPYLDMIFLARKDAQNLSNSELMVLIEQLITKAIKIYQS